MRGVKSAIIAQMPGKEDFYEPDIRQSLTVIGNRHDPEIRRILPPCLHATGGLPPNPPTDQNSRKC